MKHFHVECESPHGPKYEETVQAADPKSAKKLVAARAMAQGFAPTHFTAVEVEAPRASA